MGQEQQSTKRKVQYTAFKVAVALNALMLLAAGSNDTTIVLWDVEGGEALARLTEHRLAVTGVDFSVDGTVLVSGSQYGEVILLGVP